MCKYKQIIVINGKESTCIPLDEIILIERNRRKIQILSRARTYEYYEKLENITPLLDERFFPCLKSCYINFDKVLSMKNQQIFFICGYTYYLGRTNFIRTRKHYKNYLKNRVNT